MQRFMETSIDLCLNVHHQCR